MSPQQMQELMDLQAGKNAFKHEYDCPECRDSGIVESNIDGADVETFCCFCEKGEELADKDFEKTFGYTPKK